jgi:hypothetical protein
VLLTASDLYNELRKPVRSSGFKIALFLQGQRLIQYTSAFELVDPINNFGNIVGGSHNFTHTDNEQAEIEEAAYDVVMIDW